MAVISPSPVLRILSLFLLWLLAGWAVTMTLHAELTDAQKKKLYLESHDPSDSSSGASPTPHPKPNPSPKSTPHRKKHPTASSHHSSSQPTHPHSSTAASSHSGAEGSHQSKSDDATPTINPVSHADDQMAHPVATSQDITSSISHPQGSATTNSASAASLPLPSTSLPHGANPSAPITISKSGVEQSQGIEPAPAASSGGFFSWLFGGGGTHRTYNYLSASTRAAIDHAPVRRGRWKYIIVHNSGTREGNARIFDIYHRRVRHMVNGLAYHFVIGDGHGSGDGEIEIGHRWTAQLNGGHVASDYLNDISLGICLVGDFNRDLPTKAQIGALEELISYLRDRVGKSEGRRAIIYAHKEINPRPTDCPGDRFPYSWLHATFR
jgi:hypothetical protein